MLRLLSLIVIASGCLATRPIAESSALGSVLAKGLSMATMPHLQHEGCKATCDGEEMPHEPNVQCWGDHLYTCVNGSSIFVSKCEGHFLGFHVLDKDMWVGACEGLSHKFAHWPSTCHKTGRSSLHFMGRGCLGVSSSIIKSTPHAEPLNPPAEVAGGARLAPLLRDSGVRPGRELDVLARELPRMQGEAYGGSYEARCDGRGGEVFGVKYDAEHVALPAAAATADADAAALFDELQATIEGELGPVAPPSCPRHGHRHDDPSTSAPPPPPPRETDLLSTLVDLASSSSSAAGRNGDDEHDRPDCTLTCNDKPAGWHGLWPCWGKLAVKCESDAAAGGRSSSFSGACKGLWTGALGKMCFGLTQTHSSKTWSSGSAEMWGVCSGHLGVGGKKDEGGAAMGQWCHGKSVSRVAVEKHETAAQPQVQGEFKVIA